jgi:hypothetical protein
MAEPLLPIEATRGDTRHRDVRAEVFAVVPQRPASIGQRTFWRLVLLVARFPAGLRLLKRLRGS